LSALLVTELLNWFNANARELPWRKEPSFYRVWVSEIMLQQTRIETVIPYYLRFMESAPDVNALAALPEEKLLKLWEGLGYYSRARNLQKAAKIIAASGAFPQSAESIRELPGIGEYTAGAIASLVLDLPVPAVDGNVLRVLSRLLGHNVGKPEAAAFLQPLFPPRRCGAFTQAWMELGETLCLPNAAPCCMLCPLCKECAALREGRIAELPAKRPQKVRKIERKTVFLMRCGSRYAVVKRASGGLLADLWGFPEMAEFPEDAEIRAYWEKHGVSIRTIQQLPDSRHIFTHIEWQMKNYLLDLDALPECFPAALSAEDLLQNYAIPSAYRQLREFLKKQR